MQRRIVSMAALEAYFETFKALCAEFSDCWRVSAEDLMRGEHFGRIMRRMAKATKEGHKYLDTSFDPLSPWDGVFMAASRDSDYWMREVRAQALTFIARRLQGQPHPFAQLPFEAGATLNHAMASVGGNAMTTAAGNARKPGRRRNRAGNTPRSRQECSESGGGSARHEDGPYGGKGEHPKKHNGMFMTTAEGQQVCFAWAKNHTCSDPCAYSRAHVYQLCLGKHTNAQCGRRGKTAGAQHEVSKVHAMSTSGCEPFDEAWLQGVRCQFRMAMGLPEQEFDRMRDYDHELFKVLLQSSAAWMRDAFPSGTECPVDSCGIFPITAEDTPAVAKSRTFDFRGEPTLSHKNYGSFHQNEDLAQAEFHALDVVVKMFRPDIRVTMIACLLKVKPDLSVKVRLIVDMSRSGVYGRVTLRESVVLPRVSDLANSAVDLLVAWQNHWYSKSADNAAFMHDGEGVELAASDFANAFSTLPLRQDERKYVVVKGVRCWYVFRSVAFGLTTGPLLWGRLAAAVSQLTQSILLPWQGRLQCYVDDPGHTLAGQSRWFRSGILLRVFLFWSILRIPMNWKKPRRGSSIDWPGFQLQMHAGGVDVTMSADKTTNLLKSNDEFNATMGMLPRSQLTHIAGLMGWVSAAVPRARPFTSHLWSALASVIVIIGLQHNDNDNDTLREVPHPSNEGLVLQARV